MPDFWEFPTVSMGLGPISAIYQARFNRYLQNRGLLDTSGSRVWAFLGDGETDEPESLGALHVAAREGLDNLTFVVNCNLQRLDGPVRGNGKIIQELEAVFRGAGWNVIKVIWAREWDELLARDVDGVLVEKMNDTLDGEFQKYSVAGGAYIREHFFGPDPRLRKLVEHLSDDDLAKLRRGGHDYRKVYAAYKAATEYTGAPTVILAKTVKGWTLGPGRRGPQHHPPGEEAVRGRAEDLPRPARAADPGREAQGRAVLPPGPGLRGGPVPPRAAQGARRLVPQRVGPEGAAAEARRRRSTPSSPAARTRRSRRRWSSRRILRNLIRDKELGPRIVPIIPDEARTFGMDPLFKEVGIYAALGQRYEPVDSDLVLTYREAVDGQVLEEGITEAGSMASLQAAATSYATHGYPMIPFYIFYSMFGFQRTGDQIWALGDARGRGFMMGATAGRTTLNGEGLQHDDGHSPPPRLDHPEHPRLRPGLRLRARGDRPRRHRADVREGRGRLLLRHALQRELRPAAEARRRRRGHPPRPLPAPRGAGPGPKAHRARLVGSGSILQQVVAARDLLAEKFGIAAEIYSRAVVPAAPPRRARGRALEPAPSRQASRRSRTSRRSSAPTAGRSSPRPTG